METHIAPTKLSKDAIENGDISILKPTHERRLLWDWKRNQDSPNKFIELVGSPDAQFSVHIEEQIQDSAFFQSGVIYDLSRNEFCETPHFPSPKKSKDNITLYETVELWLVAFKYRKKRIREEFLIVLDGKYFLPYRLEIQHLIDFATTTTNPFDLRDTNAQYFRENFENYRSSKAFNHSLALLLTYLSTFFTEEKIENEKGKNACYAYRETPTYRYMKMVRLNLDIRAKVKDENLYT